MSSSQKVASNYQFPEWTDNAVLVYGPRKAGTTLLLNLMDRSDFLLATPSEVKLKFCQKQFWRQQPEATHTYNEISNIIDNNYSNFNSNTYAERMRVESVGMNSFRDMLRYDIESIYQSVAQKPQDVKMWAMKEVGGDPVQIVKFFKQQFFNGRVVVIFRRPLKITSSVLRNRRKNGIQLTVKQMFKEVFAPVSIMYQLDQITNFPFVQFVIYEELTGGQVKKEMQKICDFLQLSYSDNHEQPTIFGQKVVVGTSSKKTTQIFTDESPWYVGLTTAEKIVVFFSNIVIQVWFVLKFKKRITYADFKRRVAGTKSIRTNSNLKYE